MPASDDARDENVYEVLLQSLGNELEGRLQGLLDPIGGAIAKQIAGSPERIAEFKKRYGDEEIARLLSEEEDAVVEDFLGMAFIAAQAAYIETVVSRLKDLHELASVRSKTSLTTTTKSKRSILRHGFQPAPRNVFSSVEIVDAFANYYKHRDAWGPDWSVLEGQQERTACIIQSVGAFQSSPKNLRAGAAHFGNTSYGDVGTLLKVLAPWRKALVRDYREEIRKKSLH